MKNCLTSHKKFSKVRGVKAVLCVSAAHDYRGDRRLSQKERQNNMKKTKIGAGILAIAAAASVVVAAVVYLAQDKEGPAILFDESRQILYSEGMTEEELLQGVSARDSRDGDVSDTLQVEKVNDLGDMAVVTYVAMDTHYNVTKEERVLNAAAGGGEEEASGSMPAQAVPARESEPTGTPAATPAPTEEPEADEESQRREQMEQEIAALPEGSPELRLSQHVVTISAGSEFNQLSYVESITDDVDTQDYLFTQIQISGTVDPSTPGTYTLTYYVADSSGNFSNEDVLEVTVV